MAGPDPDWVKAAVVITPGFEVQGDPYEGVSGDFDGMGISCGALQWNIGQNSLQPMVIAVGKAEVLARMPTLGAQMWQAVTGGTKAGLAIVRGWQSGSTLGATAKKELKALMGGGAMRAEQDKKIAAVASSAFQRAEAWAQGGGTAATRRTFCWFFDLVTQNGGLNGLTPADVSDFIAKATPDKADDVVCDYLDGLTGSSGHVTDAIRNAGRWRNNAPGEKLDLLVMSYLRSGTANPKWRHVVLNRKGTIAMGSGFVNGSKWDFAPQGL